MGSLVRICQVDKASRWQVSPSSSLLCHNTSSSSLDTGSQVSQGHTHQTLPNSRITRARRTCLLQVNSKSRNNSSRSSNSINNSMNTAPLMLRNCIHISKCSPQDSTARMPKKVMQIRMAGSSIILVDKPRSPSLKQVQCRHHLHLLVVGMRWPRSLMGSRHAHPLLPARYLRRMACCKVPLKLILSLQLHILPARRLPKLWQVVFPLLRQAPVVAIQQLLLRRRKVESVRTQMLASKRRR